MNTAARAAALTELRAQVAADNEHHFHHAPVKVPRHANPFTTSEQLEVFQNALAEMIDSGNIPDGYLVNNDDWIDEAYPTAENIPTGHKRSKELTIPLPEEVWRPRAALWAQGLHVLTHMLEILENDSE